MKRIACIGEAMIELSPLGQNQARLGVAGDTFNTAVYLKRAAPELEVDYITRLGDDPFSEQIRAAIAAEDVGTDGIETETGGTPGLYAITTSDTGERSFTYWRDTAAARHLFQTDSGADFSALADYDLIYLSGITLAILPAQIRAGLLRFLHQNNLAYAFDSNYRPRLWESQSVAQTCVASYFAGAHIALPSIDDEMDLMEETGDQVIARFMALGVQGALKRGAEGPLSLGQPVHQPYGRAPKVVDTTAAGDSFSGVYIAAIAQGASQAAALMQAHTCASEVVQHRGAIIPRPHSKGAA